MTDALERIGKLWIDVPSPNANARPAGVGPELIVLHGTAGRTDAGDVAWCTDPAANVSYHYLVGRTGLIYRLVPNERRAGHAGVSEWRGRSDVNDFSIGIGICNAGAGEPYRAEQYEATGELVAALTEAYDLDYGEVVGHCHVSPGRKTDPWLHFHWGAMFARAEAILSAV